MKPDLLTPSRLLEIFDELTPAQPEEGYFYQQTTVEGFENILIAKSSAGLPALLVGHDGNATGKLNRRRFRNLMTRSSLETTSGDGFYALLELASDDQELFDWFFSVLPSVCERLSETRNAERIENELLELVELFAAARPQARQELVGLWSELLVIRTSQDPEFMIDAWHTTLNAKWDFLSGGAGLEVKATSGDRRRHQFKLEQFEDPEGLLLASVMLRETDKGLSLTELLDDLLASVDNESKNKLHDVAWATIANNEDDAKNTRFDFGDAVKALRFFRGADVPRLVFPPPEGVSHVSYQSNLEKCERHRPLQADPQLWKVAMN
jgi:hypothetical protein